MENSALAEHIGHKIQSLLTDKYANSLKIAIGIIEQELAKTKCGEMLEALEQITFIARQAVMYFNSASAHTAMAEIDEAERVIREARGMEEK